MQVVLRRKIKDNISLTDNPLGGLTGVLAFVLQSSWPIWVYHRVANATLSRKQVLWKESRLKSVKRFTHLMMLPAHRHESRGWMQLPSPPHDFPHTNTPSQAPHTHPEIALMFTWVHRFSSLNWKKTKPDKKTKLHSLGLLCKLNCILGGFLLAKEHQSRAGMLGVKAWCGVKTVLDTVAR